MSWLQELVAGTVFFLTLTLTASVVAGCIALIALADPAGWAWWRVFLAALAVGEAFTVILTAVVAFNEITCRRR